MMFRFRPRIFVSDGITIFLANRMPAGVRLKNILGAVLAPAIMQE
jgi:hypothetical protein